MLFQIVDVFKYRMITETRNKYFIIIVLKNSTVRYTLFEFVFEKYDRNLLKKITYKS